MPLRKVILSGGGTGGHIFPAIAIADQLRAKHPEVELLFVGAEGKMEMERVPEAGYAIVGLPIRGMQRKWAWSNFALPFRLAVSLLRSKKLLRQHRPDVVVGVGGYASAAIVRMALQQKIPTLIQEQNAYPGITNRWLGSKVDTICVAYDHLDRFFPKEKILKTGNPVRSEMVRIEGKRQQALQHFGCTPEKKTVVVLGGSLGARTLNESVEAQLPRLLESGVQLIWQCGRTAFASLRSKVEQMKSPAVYLSPFIENMDLAYAAADLIVSRAGAIAVSELCLVAKPTILVPSPHVAEDHQTKNALSLAQQDALLLVRDSDAQETLIDQVLDTLEDDEKCRRLAKNIAQWGMPNATAAIVDAIEKLTIPPTQR